MCPNVVKKLTPAKFKHQLVVKIQWVALVDSACCIWQAQHAMREVGRQTRDGTIQCIAAACVANCINRIKANQRSLLARFKSVQSLGYAQ